MNFIFSTLEIPYPFLFPAGSLCKFALLNHLPYPRSLPISPDYSLVILSWRDGPSFGSLKPELLPLVQTQDASNSSLVM